MALSVSGIKEIQKRLQEKDYETAYTLCQEILQSLPSPSSSTTTATTTSPPNGLLNVYVMHGTCAYQLEQYLIAEKSFRQAIELDVTGQFIQKLWKVHHPFLLTSSPELESCGYL